MEQFQELQREERAITNDRRWRRAVAALFRPDEAADTTEAPVLSAPMKRFLQEHRGRWARQCVCEQLKLLEILFLLHYQPPPGAQEPGGAVCHEEAVTAGSAACQGVLLLLDDLDRALPAPAANVKAAPTAFALLGLAQLLDLARGALLRHALLRRQPRLRLQAPPREPKECDLDSLLPHHAY